MTDDLESSLRASLQTLTVRHDDHRADEMIAVATAGRPLPGRRAMLAPLATAAAVATLGVTVAVAVSGGQASDSAPAGPPAGPPTGAASPSDREGSLGYAIALVVPPSGDRFVPYPRFPSSSDEAGVDIVHRISVDNPKGDAATVRVTDADGVVVYDEDLAGRPSATTHLDAGTRGGSLSISVQCRRPGHGDRCELDLAIGNLGFTEASPSTEAPASAEVPPSPARPVSPSASCPGCEVP